MAESVQNIKIVYKVDKTDLIESDKILASLNDEEKKMVDNFKRVDQEAKKANDTIRRESKESSKGLNNVNKDASGLQGTFKKVGGAIVAAFAVERIISFGKEVIDITARFQKLEAVLTNSLGRQSAAQSALKDIKDFAATTNFSVEELTAAYVKLANQGFIPTTNELMKLADLANSTGKQFDQLTEAIIDAQTGEFERLKEFGIRASKEGDKVTFTFKGVQTQTEFTNDAIRGYILSLGELNGVLGSTEAISETLGGKISNLGDAWDSFLNAVGQNTGGAFGKAVEIISNAFNAMADALTPIEVLAKQGVAKDIEASYQNILQSTKNYYDQLEKEGITSKEERLKILKDESDRAAQSFVNALLDAEKRQEEFTREVWLNDKRLSQLTYEDAKLVIAQETELIRGHYENATKAYEGFVADLEKSTAQITEENKKRTAKEKEENEKRFQLALKNLALEEQINTQRAKNAGATEETINLAAQYYNDRRLEIYEKFGRDASMEYEKLVVNGQALEIQLTKIVEEEARKRIASRLKADEDFLELSGNMERLGISQYYDEQLKSYDEMYLQGLIKTERYLQIKKDIEDKQRKATLQSEIDILSVQVGLYEENSKERLKIEEDLLQKQKELREIDVQNVKDIEQRKLEESKKRAEQQKQVEQAAQQFAISLYNASFEYQRNQTTQQLDLLRRQRDIDLKNAGDNEAAKNIINERFYRKDLELRRKQAAQEKQKAIFDVAIATATGIAKAAAAGAGTPLSAVYIAFMVATGAAQSAAIAARPLPKYKKGTKSVPGVDTGDDTVLAMLRPGEAVIPTEMNKKYSPIVESMLDGTLDTKLANLDYSIASQAQKQDNTELINEVRSLKQAITKMPLAKVNIDKKGVRTFIQHGNTETEFINNYFRN